MRRIKFLKLELASIREFLTMIEAYEEISAIRMRKVKKSILERREFMQGLNEAFGYIVQAYKIYKNSLKGKDKKEILNTNGKTVSVYLSSNTGLYGDVIGSTFDLFENDIRKEETDVVIVGKMGKKYYDSSGLKKTYKYFDMSDNGIDEPNIKKLLKYVVSYTEVVVYHGVFRSILYQEASKTHVTGEVMKIEQSLDSYDTRFLFEPSVERVAEHFEKQIASLIFEQTVFESSLSKFASRMVSLDKAADSIGSKIGFLDISLKKSKHADINSNLQSSIFGGLLWR
ncbi:MAG: F0F1 ATP synthase subunit gamma [Patescibacteria group bacterium]|nr:F0F1 ATP synthase subunit gamma [Patescibacteria group bacterium]MBU1953308.1 F0F1 ATP synthase subunit gamma [Patescibacteria group bacterium]